MGDYLPLLPATSEHGVGGGEGFGLWFQMVSHPLPGNTR